jgi:hypothetical protein
MDGTLLDANTSVLKGSSLVELEENERAITVDGLMKEMGWTYKNSPDREEERYPIPLPCTSPKFSPN